MAVSTASAGTAGSPDAAFFGFEPVGFVEDVYNCIDDYVADGLDGFEEAMREELGGDSIGDEVDAELVRGCDDLVTQLRGTFDENVDKFEHYVIKNVFRVPDGLVAEAGSEADDADGSRPVTGGKATAAQLQAVQDEVEDLQHRVVAARKRRRALLNAKRLCEKRLPHLREAGAALGSAAAALNGTASAAGASADAGGAEAVTAVVDKARRLDELCESLAKASGRGGRRRSTVGGASTATGATFGDVRAAYEEDKASSAGGSSVGSGKKAAAALLGSA